MNLLSKKTYWTWSLFSLSSWFHLRRPHIEPTRINSGRVPWNLHIHRDDDSVEDVDEEEVDHLVQPEDGLRTENELVRHVGQDQQGGHDQVEYVPSDQIP